MADSGVKTWLKQVVPVRLQPITISRGLLARRVADRRVLAGTFQGMHYVDASVSSAYFPKLFGTYERELAPIIKDLCLQNCPRVALRRPSFFAIRKKPFSSSHHFPRLGL